MTRAARFSLYLSTCLIAGAVSADRVAPASMDSPVFGGVGARNLPIQFANVTEWEIPRLYTPGAGDLPVLGDLGVWVDDRQSADIVWNRSTGDLTDRRSEDLLARVRHGNALKAALTKWRAVRKISDWAARRRLGVTVAPVGVKHRLGDRVSVLVERPAISSFLTVLNLTSTGEAQFIFPDQSFQAQRADIIKPGPQMVSIGEAEVTLPLGADHVVAIFTSFRPRNLHALLEDTPTVDDIAIALALLGSSTDDLRIGLAPIFTTE